MADPNVNERSTDIYLHRLQEITAHTAFVWQTEEVLGA